MTKLILRNVPRAYVPAREADGWCVVPDFSDDADQCDHVLMELDDNWQRLGDAAAGIVQDLAMRTGREK